MHPFRSSSGYFVLLCVILSQRAALAGNLSALPPGSLVLAKRPGVNFRIKNDDIGPMRAGVIERVRTSRGGWLWLGRGWVRQSDVVPSWEAVEYFTAEIGRKPTAFAYVGRASADAQRGTFANEIHADLDKALAIDEDFAPAHCVRGLEFCLQHDFDSAIEAFDDAIFADPAFAEAYAGRGAALLDRSAASVVKTQKDVKKATKDLHRATQLCPRLASPYARRSWILMLTGDRQKALAQAQEALKHDPAESLANFVVGQYWAAEGNDGRAIAAYTEAIRVDHKCGQARLARGIIYARLGENQKAIVDLNQAVQLMPRNVEALGARAFAYYRLGATEKSRADRLAVARVLGGPSKTDRLGAETTATLKIGAAIGPTEQTSSQQAEKPGSFSTSPTPAISDHLSSLREGDRALDRLNLDARRAATSTDERYLNGPRAVDLATEACEKTEWKRPDVLDTLAAAYAETGDFESAVEWQTKAIELATDPHFKADAEERLELYRNHKPCREDRPGRLARGKQGSESR
jgi:tetratricopeptide (TPR) repeat protein